MPLPKIMHPQFDILIPSTNKKIKFRQFLVKEEKILLVAKSSEDDNDILSAIKQVVNNCSLDESFDVDKIALFDLEYVFLKLRSLSVNNVVKLSFRDFEDDKLYDFEVNLDEIQVVMPKNNDNKITVNDKVGIVMRYPTASLYSDKSFLNSTPENATIDLVVRCIDKVYDDDNIYDAKNFTLQDLVGFIEELDVKSYEKINEFLTNAPRMSHVIKYKNSLNNDRTITLNTLNDFFTLR
jgi:hypothetical protein